jgi:outer membrane protein assembly complex protein YaeT
LDECLIKLEEKYRNTGYSGATVAASVLRDDEQATVDLVFQIEEKRRNVIQSVEVAGNDQTTQKFISGQLRFSKGESQNQEKINESLRGLYQTGGFRRVEIQPQPPPQTLDTKDGQVPVKMMVSVEEPKPFRFLYGGLYDTGTGPGIVTEFENRNSLGGARVAGARGRLERDFRELRVYVAQPVLRGWPWNSSVTFYVNRQDYFETYRVDKIGFSLQQDRSLGRTLRFSYGYKLENDTLALIGTSTKQSARQGILSAAFSRDLRDEFLDPRRGSFISNTLEYAPSWLGSDYGYIRYFGQYSHYFPLIKPRADPFGLETRRSPLVFASQVRLGLLKPLTNEDVVLTERFFAGGGNSIRGFPQNSVGPVDANGIPTGGNALFILNNEIRFPMISLLEGVGFLDVGNVYPRVTDLDFSDLRKSAGLGLRIKTPFIMLRFDFGFPLDLRPGEHRSVFFFSIGQSF